MTVVHTDGAKFKVTPGNAGAGKLTHDVTDESEDDEDEVPESLCCLEGCLTGTVAVIIFLFVIPTGVILSVYATNTDSESILAVGIVLIVTPILSVPVFIAIVYNRKRLKRLRKNQVGDSSKNVPERY